MSTNYSTEYAKWLEFEQLDPELKEELVLIKDKDEEIQERFYGNIQFGTGGLRGILGAGTSRMNVYMIRKATQGLAKSIEIACRDKKLTCDEVIPSAVIAYDCRHKSRLFAEEAARVLAANGIRAYVFRELQPTPTLSFAVRELQATTGIVVTASHNPPEYNGYKVYWSDGAQVASERANEIMDNIEAVEDIFAIPLITLEDAEEQGLLVWLDTDGEVLESYFKHVEEIVLQPEMIQRQAEINPLKIVFTPLHGTTGKPLPRALERVGFSNITIIKEQEHPDPNFSTVAFPNPEEPAAFELALSYAKDVDADIIIGTDPDGDRLGVLTKGGQGDYVLLTGNQTGAILLEYILSQRKAQGTLPANAIMIKTVVTSELGRVIADNYGVETEDTLTGFKYIGERIEEYTQTGSKEFQFGYEESYGYLIKDFARDKDGIQAAVMAAEVAAYYKSKGKTLFRGLQEIYQRYGYYKEALETISLKGLQGQQQILAMMTKLRKQPLKEVAGLVATEIADYETSEKQLLMESNLTAIKLPKSNVIRYTLEDQSWFCVRPSGTEPKIKFYFAVQADTETEADKKLESIRSFVIKHFT
ncbi:phospho-sugar mutase [Desulfuribacillus alkaliarsenatis]|uniref:Phosphoglucomutase n=1 Tax=Desulfuribacillus alkaliarsenatis TaxID=766136 RepID=A0A1E5G3J6_9FIRM|nr:phospho-sugar mutase [Desulfuribacillus alkaliarsenatis]OEF97645.1 phosphoglucomutase [Desulfuribacillus alkaliarsenatis]